MCDVGQPGCYGFVEYHARILELLQQCARQAHVHAGHVFVPFQHAGRPVVAPQDLTRLPPLVGIVQGEEISERLMHVQAERVIHLRHGGPPSARDWRAHACHGLPVLFEHDDRRHGWYGRRRERKSG